MTQSTLLAAYSSDGTCVRIEQPTPRFVIYALGVLFAVNGLVWTFIVRIVGDVGLSGVVRLLEDAIRGVARLEPTRADPAVGFLVGILAVLAAGLPCLFLMATRQYLLVDKARREIVRVRQYGVLTFRRATPLSNLASVAIERRADDSAAEPFAVTLLAAPGSPPFTIDVLETKDAARQYAARLAEAVGLPVIEQL
jgi:hypothetical protein